MTKSVDIRTEGILYKINIRIYNIYNYVCDIHRH